MSCRFALAVVSCLLASSPLPSQDSGVWEPPFQHIHGATIAGITGTDAHTAHPSGNWPLTSPTSPQVASFNAVHMALIPKGTYQGCVLIWDRQTSAPPQPFLRYCILNPRPNASPRFRNFFLPMPFNGDLFCAGFAWTPWGNLVIAGGATYVGTAGARVVFHFDPAALNNQGYAGDHGEWLQLADMLIDRWYPTVTLSHEMTIQGQPRYCLVFAGGSASSGAVLAGTGAPAGMDDAQNTYEAYLLNAPPYGPTNLPAIPDTRPNASALPWSTQQLPFGLFLGPLPPNPAGPPAFLANYLFEYPRLHLRRS